MENQGLFLSVNQDLPLDAMDSPNALWSVLCENLDFGPHVKIQYLS